MSEIRRTVEPENRGNGEPGNRGKSLKARGERSKEKDKHNRQRTIGDRQATAGNHLLSDYKTDRLRDYQSRVAWLTISTR
jgi:hypothetical protein